jgi:hypothetical protein
VVRRWKGHKKLEEKAFQPISNSTIYEEKTIKKVRSRGLFTIRVVYVAQYDRLRLPEGTVMVVRATQGDTVELLTSFSISWLLAARA